MSSPVDPIWVPRVDPLTPLRRTERQREKRDEPGRKHPDEPPADGEEPEDDGLHIDVLV